MTVSIQYAKATGRSAVTPATETTRKLNLSLFFASSNINDYKQLKFDLPNPGFEEVGVSGKLTGWTAVVHAGNSSAPNLIKARRSAASTAW